MGFSIKEYTFSGDTDFDVNFTLGWASNSDIGCIKVGDPAVVVEFDWIGPSRVRVIDTDLEAGDTLRFYRTVSKSTLPVDLTQPNRLTREDIETVLLHSVYLMHEVLDGRVSGVADVSDVMLNTVSDLVSDAVENTDLLVSKRYPLIVHGSTAEELIFVSPVQLNSQVSEVVVSVGSYPLVDTTYELVGESGVFLQVELFSTGEYVVSTPDDEDYFSVPRGSVYLRAVDDNYYAGEIAIGINGVDTDVLSTTEDWPSFFEVYTGARDN